MRTLLFTVLMALLSFTAYAQDEERIKSLYDTGQYQAIIDTYSKQTKDCPAESLYYIGVSYFMLDDDSKCIEYMDLYLDKKPDDPAAYYYKAVASNYQGQFEDAIVFFQKSIELDPEKAAPYSGLGDAYYFLGKLEQALESYKKAIEQEKLTDRDFYMIAQIYYDKNEYEKALEAYYTAKSNAPEESEFYQNILFNIGLLEILINEDYEKAESAYLELLNSYPDDYHAYAKLIQIYYHKERFEEANLYRDKLYEFKSQGLLDNSNVADMFCFDQFNWNGKQIMAFERYDSENKGKIYDKHLFYITDGKGNTEFSIQTEFSPISLAMGGPKYILCSWRDGVHINFGIGLDDDFDYRELKDIVIMLLEENYK